MGRKLECLRLLEVGLGAVTRRRVTAISVGFLPALTTTPIRHLARAMPLVSVQGRPGEITRALSEASEVVRLA